MRQPPVWLPFHMTEHAGAIKVDIWSDVACPWCYIGKRRFEAALERFEGDVVVEYHSFELAPDTPEDFAGSHKDYLVSRGFPAEQIDAMDARIVAIGGTLGLDYDYEANKPTRTLLAHELIHYAKARGRQAEMKERLLAAYFERGEHVGRIDDLVAIAAELGFDPDDVRRSLESHEYAEHVQIDIAGAQSIGVRGVPFYVFDRKYAISGAQEPETFLDVLNAVSAERATAADD